MSLSVRFFGPMNEHSGYGYAVKNFANAFSRSDIKTHFAFAKGIKDKYPEFWKGLDHYPGKCDVDFYLHGPPWTRHRSRARYKIGYFYWETDSLPSVWKRSINSVNEIWAPCDLVKKICLEAGFKGRIRVVPTPIEAWETDKRIVIPSKISRDYIISDNVYKFYSIFQWHERKGYRELLSSYYRTFTKNNNVILILKVNPLNIQGNTRERIKVDILDIKRKLNLKYYPPVYLINDLIPEEDIHALHMTGDCLVSPHHGEGWGMPIHNAMWVGNQIITTKFGGVTDHLDNNSAHIIEHRMGPVKNMSWSGLYNSSQNWAYPSTNHLRKILRDVYENNESYISKGIAAQKIAERMTVDTLSVYLNKVIGKQRLLL